MTKMSLLKQLSITVLHLRRVDSMDEAEDVRRLRGCLDEHDEAAVERSSGEVVRVKPLPLAEAFEGIATQRMIRQARVTLGLQMFQMAQDMANPISYAGQSMQTIDPSLSSIPGIEGDHGLAVGEGVLRGVNGQTRWPCRACERGGRGI